MQLDVRSSIKHAAAFHILYKFTMLNWWDFYRPMSSSSNVTSSPCKCKVDDEIVGLSTTRCVAGVESTDLIS